MRARARGYAPRLWSMPNWLTLSLVCVGMAASHAVNVPTIGLHAPEMSPLASHLQRPRATYLAPVLPDPVRTRWERAMRPPDDDYPTLAPPPGHGIMSVPIDSACTVHIIKDDRWFSWLRPAKVSIQTANDAVEVAKEQGAAVLNCYSTRGRHAPLMLHDAVHAPQMHSLLSVSRLLDIGVKVLLKDQRSYLEFPDGTRVPVRRNRGLFLLDVVVPLEQADDTLDAHNAMSATAAHEHEYTGTETVPDAHTCYPNEIPIIDTPENSNATINHWRWGHLHDRGPTWCRS